MKASGCEVELSRNRFINQEAFVSHVNAALTPRTRLRLARLVVESGWTYAAAAKMFMVAPRTARKWADRYRAEGQAGMAGACLIDCVRGWAWMVVLVTTGQE